MMEREADNSDAIIGARLAERMALVGVSQTALGATVGVSYQQIQKYADGTNRLPLSYAVAFCHRLGMSITDLVLGVYDQLPPDTLGPLSTRAAKIAARLDKLALAGSGDIVFPTVDALLSGFEKPSNRSKA